MTVKTRSIFALFVLVFVALMAVQVMARGVPAEKAANTLEITGTVDAMTADTITVGGLVINIAQAELNTPIMLGETVKVHYMVAADGTLVAREVGLPGTPEATDTFGGDHGQDGTPEATEVSGNDPGHDVTPEATENSGDDHGHDATPEVGHHVGGDQGHLVNLTPVHSINGGHGNSDDGTGGQGSNTNTGSNGDHGNGSQGNDGHGNGGDEHQGHG